MTIERPAQAKDAYEDADVRHAARALLRHPMMGSTGPDPDAFRLVRRHRVRLTRLFAEALGYRLVVDARSARLFKAGLGADATRPLVRRNGAAFTPHAYAILCVVLAALTRAKSQLLIDELVAQVRSAAADGELTIDLETTADRRALHAALMMLIGRGVLTERDSDSGGIERWAEDPTAGSLLNVDRDRLHQTVSAPLSSMTSPSELLQTMSLSSAVGGARVSIRRRLVESPVLSTNDLTDEQADWWTKNRHRERERLLDLFGLDLELRAEGALAVDPDDEVTDIQFPGAGTTKRLALLVLDQLVHTARDRHLPPMPTWTAISIGEVAAAIDDVARTYEKALTKPYREDPASLHRDVRDLLTSVGLVIASPDGWLLHAAAARYAPRAEFVATAPPSLFDVPDAETPREARDR
jgi:uncharacterized protein (TIGR02678 family)